MSLRNLFHIFCYTLLLSTGLSACIKPHQITINQGNLVNNEDFERLEVGMTKKQVEFLIGRPVLIEPFDKNHWEYVYVAHRGEKQTIKKKMVLAFKGEKLIKIDGSIIDNQTSSANNKANQKKK